jgi:hypothetical protein
MLRIETRKITLIVLRADLDDVIRDMILIGCIDVGDPGELLEDRELAKYVWREEISLEQLQANKGNLPALATNYTILLTGWIPAVSESRLLLKLSKYICASEIADPSPDEYNKIPVKLKWPNLFGRFYKNSQNLFSPLAKKSES